MDVLLELAIDQPESDENKGLVNIGLIIALLRKLGGVESNSAGRANQESATQQWTCAFDLYDLALALDPHEVLGLIGRQQSAAALGSHVVALEDAAEALHHRLAAGMLTQGGQVGHSAPSASRCIRIPTRFPLNLHAI